MMPVVLLLVVGAAAGYVATRAMRVNVDLPSAMGIGMIGAVLGGLGLRLLLSAAPWFIMFVVAVLAAMGMIWLWQRFFDRR